MVVSNLESDISSGGWKYLLTDAFVVVMMSSFSVMFFEVCNLYTRIGCIGFIEIRFMGAVKIHTSNYYQMFHHKIGAIIDLNLLSE